MKLRMLAATITLLVGLPPASAYVEAPHTLGRCCHESTNIVLVEVARVNREKGLILFKKVQDLKGNHPEQDIKHNIGQRGFHPREWQNVMKWAEVGKRAVFFHNGGASETCIGTYWYQCYREGDWWGMSHAEPFLLRTYCGDPEKLAAHVEKIQKGQEVVVPCLVDGNKEQLHQRKGKLQRLRASLKRIEYDARRDFVAFGGDGDEVEEFKTVTLLAQSTPGWKFLPAALVKKAGDAWRAAAFNDSAWRTGKAPVGYGEDEIGKRQGTIIKEQGQPFVFRRAFDVPGSLFAQKGVTFRLAVASDDSATVWLNGELVDQDPEADHEFAYWNRDVELAPKHLRPGRNVLAVLVRNKAGCSDLYLDVELEAQVPIPRPKRPPRLVASAAGPSAQPTPLKLPTAGQDRAGGAPVVDRQKRTVTVPCAIAPRKLPTLDQVYPVEVVACHPAPDGQKAHETVVTISGFRPSAVHKALESLGLKPGNPAVGEDTRATGPELKVYLELPGRDGKPQRLPLEQALVDRKTGKPLPPLRWHFTGSVTRQPDPEKDTRVYGADLTGTLIALFPVTEDTVIQTSLTMKDEPVLKLDTNKALLPKEGTPAKLIIERR